jgi:hypothetical protein
MSFLLDKSDSYLYMPVDECGSELLRIGHERLEKGASLIVVSAYGAT